MRKSLAVLAATALLALSSGCGSESDRAGDAKAVADTQVAAAATSPASAPLTRENFVERVGAAQLEAGSAHLDMTASGSGMAANMSGDVRVSDDLDGSAAALSMDLAMVQMELRLVDGILYAKMGQLTDGKFVKLDLADENSPIAQKYGSLTDQVDPAKQLKTFRAALVEFENQGDGGEVDGVPTTKLRLVVDTAKALGKQSGEAKKHSATMPKTMEYVLYVGQQDDLLRRITTEAMGAPVTIDWSRWGETVEVEAPPKSDITDRAHLAPRFGAGAAALKGLSGPDLEERRPSA